MQDNKLGFSNRERSSQHSATPRRNTIRIEDDRRMDQELDYDLIQESTSSDHATRFVLVLSLVH
ncbi:hypothetical protein PSHT_08758 [Puccinia striiformis]|uniref:Uncharacterized protein n=1 Tax=Puccinia striiformis TaxID=27350 RepID=A0A2S4VLQ8_9BASI|nr:hypothetical protein PSHT_08758 [Puccinia striiformis]